MFTCVAFFPIKSLQGNPGFERIKERWQAPSWTDTLLNPLPKTVSTLEAGRKIYLAECIVCHGRTGRGEGESGFGLRTPPGDLTDEFNRLQRDGALYWKIEQGIGQMPSYAAKTNETQRWQLVLYIRKLQEDTMTGSRKKVKQ